MLRRKFGAVVGIALGLILLGAIIVWICLATRPATSQRPAPVGEAGRRTGEANATSTLDQTGQAGDAALLRHTREALQGAKDATEAHRLLTELRSQLSKLSPGVASTVIRRFLDSGHDSPTHLSFTVSPSGFLNDAPSLRVWLLDYLAQVDPPAARDYAKLILNAANSPEEWAVSLRNYALADPTPEGRAYLEEKMRLMLQNDSWQKNPSMGFLEAFDVAVYVGGNGIIPMLTQLVRQTDNQALSHAAYLALDRLALQDPKTLLGELQQQPDLMKGREATRGNYFARADVRDVQQKALLENYLLNPQLGDEELNAFAGTFPNANYMISNNLLTRTETPNREMLARHDRAALKVVEGWLADARFARIKLPLEKIRRRLEIFVAQTRDVP